MKLCRNCDKEIDKNSRQYSNKYFCEKKCKKKYHLKIAALETRVKKKRARLTQNKEVVYLLNQCKNAGTVQILYGHSLESFLETMALVRNRPKAKVHLCHIAPVKGRNAIGLFHCKNFFYGGAYQNSCFKNGYISGGLSISKKHLLKKWSVTDAMTNSDILILIEEYMPYIIQRYLEIVPVEKSKKVQAINKILFFDGAVGFDELMQYSHKELSAIAANLTKEKPWVFNVATESKYMAYMDSLTRFIAYGGERTSLLKKLRNIMVVGYMALSRVAESETNNKYFYVKYEPLIVPKYGQAMLKDSSAWREFKDLLYDAAFKVLQGGDINIKAFRKLLFSYLTFPEKAFLDDGSTGLSSDKYSLSKSSNLTSFLYGSLIFN